MQCDAITGMWVVRCFFAIGCRLWTSGDDRLTLNVTRIGIILSICAFHSSGVRRLLSVDTKVFAFHHRCAQVQVQAAAEGDVIDVFIILLF
eukprot:scaffold149115_cov41-Attheya_sp.AAC.3